MIACDLGLFAELPLELRDAIYCRHLCNYIEIVEVVLKMDPYSSMSNAEWRDMLGDELHQKVIPFWWKKQKLTEAKSVLAGLVISNNRPQSQRNVSLAWKAIWRYGKGNPAWIHFIQSIHSFPTCREGCEHCKRQ